MCQGKHQPFIGQALKTDCKLCPAGKYGNAKGLQEESRLSRCLRLVQRCGGFRYAKTVSRLLEPLMEEHQLQLFATAALRDLFRRSARFHLGM